MKTFVFALALAGCIGGKLPITDEPDSFADEDLKADLTKSSKYVGDATAAPVTFSYTTKPKYRTVSFRSQAGLIADIWVDPVGAAGGDPVTWLLDFQHKIVAKNDDASDANVSSHLHVTLPSSNSWYYVIVRDYDWSAAKFRVNVKLASPPGIAGQAQHAYDTTIGAGLGDTYQITRAALPAAAQATFDAWSATYVPASAFKFPAAGQTIYAVASGGEEIYWVDLYDGKGQKVAHGYGGDGGPEVTDWSGHSPYDPTVK
jgi:hypothetical protein